MRVPPPPTRPAVATIGGASLRDHGGSGPLIILVPSLINPPSILDLDRQVSLADWLQSLDRRVLLVDWGSASGRRHLSVGGHVEQLLVPLLETQSEPAALVGYCLGGTMAIAAANLVAVERVVTLAAPWRFAAYPAASRESVQSVWRSARPAATALGVLPVEVLQAAFWSLDPQRTVAKFARFATLEPDSAQARRFVHLEDWANEGEPLPLPAARELIEDFFGADLPGSGGWILRGQAIGDRLAVPTAHLTAANDRIVPASTAAAGRQVAIPAGHVGMVVGSARVHLHAALSQALAAACR